MAARVSGKVVLITGAARGQGRNHAIRLAEEGANIIAIDLCDSIPGVPYALATPEDLAETTKLVEAVGGRVLPIVADVRSREQMMEAVARGLVEFGRIDVVIANAGIAPIGLELPPYAFIETLNVNYIGVVNTIGAAMPHLESGASVIAIGSIAAFTPGTVDVAGPGGGGYSHSKQAVARLVSELAALYGPEFIRVNAIHPTNVNTHMMHNEAMYRQYVPDVENPTREQAVAAMHAISLMPLPYVEQDDVSNAVVYLASDESRYVTGLQFKVDAGALLRALGPGLDL